ncbi:phosphoadenosine phosphosulfate reductase family protein [Halorubrum sp. JWXQ-INN 858]|uniref:phosphoadenosine phosphosulfate reductase family protein n=1 Tax=Halorubrum sp. JWXQ-INN 858 TaxID=2690782 RepID=UPI0013FA852F|nr:phosphoadenosine phosphosulfate reductase family protein [Halorubrum sp. JWXQ-INN 858]MWV65494.1 phosphoadenosine phosphosulfate reductase family protein [Halorubrum sp. JWXQ-INN 858]
MSDPFPDYVDVDYEDGSGAAPDDYGTLEEKTMRATDCVGDALEQYRAPALMWTGGKDSTLALYVAMQVAEERGLEVPPVLFIDHLQHFPEVRQFVERWTDRWDLDLRVVSNEDFASVVEARGAEPGDAIPVDALNERNRRHVRDVLEYEEETFPFLLDTYVGNHLLKTVALNDALEAGGFDAVISGVRWDEQAARADETFFSPRHDPDLYPPHDRVHPILQFTERDVWNAFFRYVLPDTVPGYPVDHVPRSTADLPEGIAADELPISPKYFEGFRSLGSEVSTESSGDTPAWLQDLEGTTERAGRAQDKEDLMGRLRDLGYM